MQKMKETQKKMLLESKKRHTSQDKIEFESRDEKKNTGASSKVETPN